MNKTRICVLVLIIALVALSVAAPVAGAGKRGNSPGVIPPNATPGGMSYGDWGAAWWQWAMSIPKAVNPMADPTGDMVGSGQSGHVWFLCGTITMTPTGPTTYVGYADREVTIPAGKMLFFPICNVEASTAEGNGTTYDELAGVCDWYMSRTTPTDVTVDGRHVKNLMKYRAMSGLYQLWWPVDNVIDLPPISLTDPKATTTSVSDGYWIMLAPLSRGTHHLHWSGATVVSVANGDDFDATWAQDITYTVHVK
jgi:hypothetical protein